jgi:hypothetical protein
MVKGSAILAPNLTVLRLPTQPPMSLRAGSRAKRWRLAPIPDELGKLIDRDLKLFKTLGWEALVSMRQGCGNISSLDKLRHPARRLL